MTRALLIGATPDVDLGYCYVREAPYDAVVLGSLSLGQLLYFREEQVLDALAAGKTVVVYSPGLPVAAGNRALAAKLAASRRELKSLGVTFADGSRRHLITAQEAKAMRMAGKHPGPGAVMTPLAREILEGTD